MNLQTLLKTASIVLLGAWLSACQTTARLDVDKSASTVTPNEATQAAQGAEYLWGGKILQVENRGDNTEITVLSYPLSGKESPQARKESTGRFVAVYPGYLEPVDYAQGKYITVLGAFSGYRDGMVEGADYRFPLLNASNVQLHQVRDTPLRIPFSIGVGISL